MHFLSEGYFFTLDNPILNVRVFTVLTFEFQIFSKNEILPITRNSDSFSEIVYTRCPNYRELTVHDISSKETT